jgi:hypothetical protein
LEPSNTLLRLRKRLENKAGKAIADYNMIEDGDTVLVCISGGKDSYTLLSLLMALRKRAPVDFRLIAMNLDQKQPGFPADVLPGYLAKIGVEYRIVEQDTYSVVKSKIPPKARPPARCVPACVAASSIVPPRNSAPTRSPLATIATTSCIRSFSISFSAASSRRCRRNWSPTTAPMSSSDRWPTARSGHRAFRARHGVPDHPVQSLRLAGQSAAPEDPRNDGGLGSGATRDAPKSVFSALQKVVPSHLADQACLTSRVCVLAIRAEHGGGDVCSTRRRDRPCTGSSPLPVVSTERSTPCRR